MVKKSNSRSTSRTAFYLAALVFLLIIAGVVLLLQQKVNQKMFVQYLATSLQKYEVADATEDAQVLATTIANFPTGYPLYVQKGQLQEYIAMLSKQTGRDMVIVDTNKIILADTIPANIAKIFAEDKGGEVEQTLQDSQPRGFIETSIDYPKGISQVVVPLKNGNGTMVGAVIMSGSSIFSH